MESVLCLADIRPNSQGQEVEVWRHLFIKGKSKINT